MGSVDEEPAHLIGPNPSHQSKRLDLDASAVRDLLDERCRDAGFRGTVT
jgi:hypothetical protein